MASTLAHAAPGDGGYLCGQTSLVYSNEPKAKSMSVVQFSESAPDLTASAEERRCTTTSDCQQLPGVCNRCWHTVNNTHLIRFTQMIQKRQAEESCVLSTLLPVHTVCVDKLCRLRAN